MSKPLTPAQRDGLLRLARAWAAGEPQPWDDLRPQTREALRRLHLADMRILPDGLAAVGLHGVAVWEWRRQVWRAADADARLYAHLLQWFSTVPLQYNAYGRPVPVVTAADLRAAADALGPLEDTAAEARRQAEWLEGPARAEVRAALGVDDV
jgi:hypothetical protein